MRTTRILLLVLCLALANEARRYPIDEEESLERTPHHKHRHRHELQSRWPAGKNRASNDEDDYYDEDDYEDYEDEEEEEEEYRSHSPKRSGSNHRRYPSRYHHRVPHHVGSARGHEGRAHDRHRLNGGYRNRWKDEESERPARRRHEEEEEEDDYHGKQHKRSKARSRSRYEPDWRYRLDDEEDDRDDEESEEQPERHRHSARRTSYRHREDESPKAVNRRSSYNKQLDEWMRRVRNSSRSYERRNPELDDDDDDDDEEEIDNDFYENDESTSLKSYDDIIRRLTEERSTEAPYSRRSRLANLVDKGKRLDEEAQADANMDYSEDDSQSSASTTTTTTTTRPWWNSASRNTRNFRSDSQAKKEPPMSAISAAKWDNLGTREAVEKTRNNMLSENSKALEFNAVQSHAIRVAREGSCRWPRAKVIPVLDIYYNSTATYYPHCVILHRCSDDTGCCRSESLTCEAKQSQRVELAFHVTYIHGNQGIARLSFDNHTECRCSERKSFDGHRNPRHNMQAPANIVKQQRPRKPCRCPSNFLPTITSDDTCECTCPDKEETCHKLLIGKGYLSNVDRVCIQSDMCTAPKCVYGAYVVENGSCPLKRKFVEANAWPRRPSNNYQYPRGRSWRSP